MKPNPNNPHTTLTTTPPTRKPAIIIEAARDDYAIRFALRRQLWSDREDARLVSATGVPALPSDVSSTTVEEFSGAADAQIAEAAGLATPPFCTNLRIRRTAGLGGGLRIPGVDGGKLVCLPGQGRSCRCLVAARQAATKDGTERQNGTNDDET